MRKINHVVFGFVLFCLCTMQIQIASAQELNVTANSILKENVTTAINLPAYNSELQSGDQFVYILSLGYALDLKALTFNDLSFEKISMNRSVIDDGYLFSRMMNDILIFKGNSYTQGGILEKFGNQSKLLYSATYANLFGLIGMIPSPGSISWKNISKVQKGEIRYALNFSLGQLNFDRGWLNMTDLQDANLPKGSSIITGLILTNKLQLNLYKEGSLIEKMKNDNMTIIGFICTVI
ncbi:hypothetical protein [Bacteroides neonati]|uniref:hypothetical protein n=1 Tax=Bacteroides neonati TaxID=1347393 RepID=UPI0011DE175F|nr:hypothetical protein [Bacteroides neonati]